MQNNSIPYEQLPITNNFMFCKVFSDKEICKEFLETILKIKIDRLELVQSEFSKMADPASKTVRFDVYVKSSDQVFDIELQMAENKNLPLRARYYQSMCDIDTFDAGARYEELKQTYIIFLCPFDLFEKDLPIYTFTSLCRQDNKIELGDKSEKIFINFKKYDKITDDDTKALLKYLSDGKSTSTFTDKIADKLHQARGNQLWRREFMMWIDHLKEEAEILAKEMAQDMAQEMTEEKVQETEYKTRLETAQTAISMGFSKEQIMQLTKLSLKEINNLLG